MKLAFIKNIQHQYVVVIKDIAKSCCIAIMVTQTHRRIVRILETRLGPDGNGDDVLSLCLPNNPLQALIQPGKTEERIIQL